MEGDDFMVFIITYIIIGIIGWLITNAAGIILIAVADIDIDWEEFFQGYALWMTFGIIAWAILWPLTALAVVWCLIKTIIKLI